MPTYNVVSEGADTTGRTPVDPILEDIAGSETTIVFPEGTYRLGNFTVGRGTDDLRLVAPEGARLVPDDAGDGAHLFDVYGDGFVLDGFELDMRGVEVPPLVRMWPAAGDWELRRLVTRGKVRAATDRSVGSGDWEEARTYFKLSAAPGSRGLLQDCYFHTGSCGQTEASNRRAILVEKSKGDLVFNRCWFELWGENTIYAKKPRGNLSIYNCFMRNTNNGLRLGGNTEVRNCVSIKDAEHPRSAWSNGSIQRGVVAEAIDPAEESRGVNSYAGTLAITDCDFLHRYGDDSSRPPIAAPTPCQRIDVRNVRISYDSTRHVAAVYTDNGRMRDGTPTTLEYLQLRDVHVRNDNENAYAISIKNEPEEWGTLSGVIGGTGRATDSRRVRSRMTVDGDPDEPDTTPPLAPPPEPGDVPLESARLLRIDNADNESRARYVVGAGRYVLPAGNDGATVTMTWGPGGNPRRPPDSTRATGRVPPGEAHAFYVAGDVETRSRAGSAVWTLDGEPYTPDSASDPGTDPTPSRTRGEGGADSSDGARRGSRGGGPTDRPNGESRGRRGRDSSDPDDGYLDDLSRSAGETVALLKFASRWIDPGGHRATDAAFDLGGPAVDPGAVSPDPTLPTFEAGVTELAGGDLADAGVLETDGSRASVEFDAEFDDAPVLFTRSRADTGNGPTAGPDSEDGPTVGPDSDSLAVRQYAVSSREASVRVERPGDVSADATVTLGYLAVPPGVHGVDGTRVEVGRVTVSPGECRGVTFARSYGDPFVVAELQAGESSEASTLALRNLTTDGVDIGLETDPERTDPFRDATDGSRDPAEDAGDPTGEPGDAAAVVGYLVAARD